MTPISDDIYRLLLLSPLGVVVHDGAGSVLAANQSFADLLGYPLDEVKLMSAASIVHPADMTVRNVDAERVILGELGSLTLRCRLLHRDGSAIAVETYTSTLTAADGHRWVMVQVVDLREEVSRIAELEHAVTHDGLTGLLTRSALLDRVQRRLDAYRPMTVALIDLDSFKSINDTHGHVVGDYVLQEIARRLAFVGPADSLVARLSGDEFVVACEGVGGEELCRNIEHIFDLPVQLGNDRSVKINGSCGSAVAPTQSDAIDAIAGADQAMYISKYQRRRPPQRALGIVQGPRYIGSAASVWDRSG